jgi:ABC-type metal ion transport system substrate-binding protein
VEEMNKLNKAAQKNYKLGIQEFSDLTLQEFKVYKNYKLGIQEFSDWNKKNKFCRGVISKKKITGG